MSELRLSPEVQSELKQLAQAFQVSTSDMLGLLMQNLQAWDALLDYQQDPGFSNALERVMERYADFVHAEDCLS